MGKESFKKSGYTCMYYWFPGGASGKEPTCQCKLDGRDTALIPGWGRSPGEGHSNPLHYSCLENPMDRGAWQAAVHMVAQNRKWLKWLSTLAIPDSVSWN